jgi:4-amino-4-deoxy-L-arabinose transferase-like glycosyltransferase
MKEFNIASCTVRQNNNPYGRTNRLVPILTRIVRRFNRWRLVFLFFLIAYTALLLLYLDYAPIRWDETPHLYGGLLLHNGQFDDYLRESSFYPPLFDAVTAFYFKVLGVSVFSARLVAVTFGILSVWTVFEYAYKFYSPRNALISSVLLASMPGFIILCRMALIETMLLFFFSISLLLFFSWMRTHNDKMLLLSGLTLGLGFLVKYQALVGGIIMLASILFFGRQYLASRLSKFFLIVIIAGAVVAPWIFVTYQQYSSGMLEKWFYVIRMGNEERLAYSTRFPTPVFYLIEMTQPYPHIHPIYLPIYILALLGLGLWLWRRREEDKFSLVTFFVVYLVFTLIASKDWRYVTLVFPILAVSASEFILFLWDKAKSKFRAPNINFRKKNVIKIAAAVFVLLTSVSVIYSSWEAYVWLKFDHVNIPIGEATQYVAERATLDEEIVVLCGGNYFSVDMVEFYLLISNPNREQPMQYPELPVDAYMPTFNVTWLIETSETLHVKYLLLYEHGNITFFQSELTSHDVLETMLDTQNFVVEKEFGSFPRRIFILRFSNS